MVEGGASSEAAPPSQPVRPELPQSLLYPRYASPPGLPHSQPQPGSCLPGLPAPPLSFPAGCSPSHRRESPTDSPAPSERVENGSLRCAQPLSASRGLRCPPGLVSLSLPNPKPSPSLVSPRGRRQIFLASSKAAPLNTLLSQLEPGISLLFCLSLLLNEEKEISLKFAARKEIAVTREGTESEVKMTWKHSRY